MMILKSNPSSLLKQPQQCIPRLGVISSPRNEHRCRLLLFDYASSERQDIRLSLSASSPSSCRYHHETTQDMPYTGRHRTDLKSSVTLQIFVLRQFPRRISLQCFVAFASTVEGDVEATMNNIEQGHPESESKGNLFTGTKICSEGKIVHKPENDIKVETSVAERENSMDGEVSPNNVEIGSEPKTLDTSGAETNAVVIVFDIETTGLNPCYDRIIEFAARDLAGGDCSTLQTFVNPEMHVPLTASNIHGIYSDMVNRPDIPKWNEVAPVVLEFVERRGGCGGLVFLVAHNGRKFDVPFLVKEFQRCSMQIPYWWRFVDTMPIARLAMKAKGLKGVPLKLTSLHELYNLPSAGKAHRALADVGMLANVLKMLMIDLKMPVSALLERSFTTKDIKASATSNDVSVERLVLQHQYSVEGYKEVENHLTPWDNLPTFEASSGHTSSSMLNVEEPALSLPETSSTVESKSHKEVSTEQPYFPFLDRTGHNKFLGPTCKLDTSDLSQLSSMLQQHVESKRQRPKLLHLWRVLDFYVAFFEDAENLSRVFGVGLTAVIGGKDLNGLVPMASLHNSQVNCCIHTLLTLGIPVYKQDQVYRIEHKGALLQECKNLVLTPGMNLNITRPQGHANNYLMSVVLSSNEKITWGIAYADLSTGEFYATEAEGSRSLVEEISLVQPSEIIYPDNENNEIWSTQLPPGFCYTSRLASEFSLAGSIMTLQEKFGRDVLERFGFGELPMATCAAAGLLKFIDENLGSLRTRLPFHKISIYFVHDYMLLDRSSKSFLEVFSTRKHGGLVGSLLWAVDQTKTNMGKRMLRKWVSRPLLDKDSIYARQDAVEIFLDDADLRTQVRCDLALMNDLQRLGNEVACGLCTPWDFVALAQSINIVQRLASKLGCHSNPHFLALVHGKVLGSLSQKIQNLLHTEACHIFERGHAIKDNVDEILDSFRVEIYRLDLYIQDYEKTERSRLRMPSLEVKTDDSGEYYFSISKHDLHNVVLPIDYQIYKLGNPELVNFFISPTLSESSKKLRELRQKARVREAEILNLLKEDIYSLLQQIHATGQTVAEIDVLASFAEVAALRGYCKPVMVEDSREITVVEGRHPVVELLLRGAKHYSPNSTYMGYGSGSVEDQPQRNPLLESDVSYFQNTLPRPDVMILTGPPNSGKSCYLKQVALIQILSQIGSYVPAKKTCLGICDALYMRVDDGDDLLSGMGNFQINIAEYAEILNNVSSQSLVLFDGVSKEGRNENNAVTRAVVEYLTQTVRARVLLTSQQGNLCALEGEYPNISNFHFEDCENTISPYCIEPGFFLEPTSLNGSKLGGLSEWVARRALELISSESRGVGIFSFDKLSREMDERITTGTGSEKPEVMYKAMGRMNSLLDEELEKKEVIPKEMEKVVESVSFHKASRKMDDRVMPVEGFEKAEVYLEDGENIKDVKNLSSSNATKELNEMNTTSQESIKYGVLSREVENVNKIEPNSRPNVTTDDVVPIPEYLAEDMISCNNHLADLWLNMLKVLQNNPATYALTKQKGSLISVEVGTEVSHVHVATSALFIKKFLQHQHETALEGAFRSVLHTPINLKITSTEEETTPKLI